MSLSTLPCVAYKLMLRTVEFRRVGRCELSRRQSTGISNNLDDLQLHGSVSYSSSPALVFSRRRNRFTPPTHPTVSGNVKVDENRRVSGSVARSLCNSEDSGSGISVNNAVTCDLYFRAFAVSLLFRAFTVLFYHFSFLRYTWTPRSNYQMSGSHGYEVCCRRAYARRYDCSGF